VERRLDRLGDYLANPGELVVPRSVIHAPSRVFAEFDFRAGGRERFGFKMDGTTFRYDARYYDIVPDQRISVSVSSL
jgi:hypothetical protein